MSAPPRTTFLDRHPQATTQDIQRQLRKLRSRVRSAEKKYDQAIADIDVARRDIRVAEHKTPPEREAIAALKQALKKAGERKKKWQRQQWEEMRKESELKQAAEERDGSAITEAQQRARRGNKGGDVDLEE